jgi:hypothetical protein
LQSAQKRFSLPCGQGLQSTHLPFSLPCGHRFRPTSSIPPAAPPSRRPPSGSHCIANPAPRVVRTLFINLSFLVSLSPFTTTCLFTASRPLDPRRHFETRAREP